MDKFGVAIVGASGRSDMMFKYLRRNPECGFVTGIYDLIPARGRFQLEKFTPPDAVIYETLPDAVADPRAQVVFIGTSDDAHVEPTVAALKAGKPVYCEKPMAITVAGCDELIHAARDAQSVFYLGMNMRHTPVHEKLHDILDSGALGKLLTIEANEYYIDGRTYFRRWNRLRKHGGGLWITKACHDFDLLNWFAGGRPQRVFAASSLSYYKPIDGAGPTCRTCNIKIKNTCPDYFDVEGPEVNWRDDLSKITERETGAPLDLCLYNSDKDTFDNGIALVDFDNDVRATYTVNVVSGRDTRQMRLMGTKGSAEGDMRAGWVKVWKRYSKETEEHDLTEQVKSSHGGSDKRILSDFFRCCRTGEKPRSSWSDGRLSIQVALAARDSCDTGSVVHLEPLE